MKINLSIVLSLLFISHSSSQQWGSFYNQNLSNPFPAQGGNPYGNMYYNLYMPQSASPYYNPISNPSGAIPITIENNNFNNGYYTPSQWGQVSGQSMQSAFQNILAGAASAREERYLQMQERLIAEKLNSQNNPTLQARQSIPPPRQSNKSIESRNQIPGDSKIYSWESVLDNAEDTLIVNKEYYRPDEYQKLAMMIAYIRIAAPEIKKLGHTLYIEKNGPEWIKDTFIGNDGKELLLDKIYKNSQSEFVRDVLPRGKFIYEDKNGLAWQDPIDDSVVIMTADLMMDFLRNATMLKKADKSAKVLVVSKISLKPYIIDIPL